jgi:hypothetical protein
VRAGESGIRLIFEMRIAAPGPRFFKPFSALRLMGVLSSVVAKIARPRLAPGFAVFADLVEGTCSSWWRGGCGLCRTLADSAEGSEAESLFSKPVL